MNGTATDWSSEFKFSSFFKTHYNTKVLGLTEDHEVVPSYFYKLKRTLHYPYFPEKWMECKDIADVAIGETKKEELKRIISGALKKEEQNKGSDYEYVKELLIDKFKLDPKVSDEELISKFESSPKVSDTEAWLQCYFGFPSPPTWAEEGIAYRILCGEEGCHWTVFFLNKGKKSLFGLGKRLVDREVEGYSYGEVNSCNLGKEYNYKDSDSSYTLPDIQEKCLKIFEDQESDQGIEGYWQTRCLVFPIREIYLSNKGYGGVWGFLTIYFHSPTDITDDKVTDILTSLSPNLTAASYDYFNSGLWNVEEEKWDLDDTIIEHFLKTIPYIQDWENIWITKDSETIAHWGREENSFMTDWKKKECKKHERGKGNNFEWKLRNIEMFLNETEREPCKDILDSTIYCEFPKISFLPKDNDNDQKRFEDKLREQQLKVFEIVINKWRRRRAALRSAMSAVMGRNMSHNIGSHVIARYAAIAHAPKEQREGGRGLGRGEIDHRTVFFQYLQKRMDFIAEVSTSDKPNWSQPLGLVEVLDNLNFEKEKKRINEKKSKVFDPDPILLSYITGKEGIKASVCIDEHTKEYFNCPSGDVGVHALYVILENIIRNSARHNTNLGGEVKLKVEVIDSDQPELLKLEITDCQTEEEEESGKSLDVHINGIIQNEPFLNEDGSPNSKYWGIREMQICAQHLRGLPLSELGTPLPQTNTIQLGGGRGGADATAGDGDDTPRVLEAFIKPENDKPRLAYQLYLQRPKLCAIVAKICCKLRNPESRKKLKKMGIALFDYLPDLAELRGYSFAVLPKGLKDELSDKSQRLQLPIRTLYVGNESIEKLLSDIKSWVEDPSEFSPAKLLDPLHRHLWEHRYKRNCWNDKEIKTLVGWKEEIASLKRSPFSHVKVDSEPYQDWGYDLIQDTAIGLVWVDHANNKRFLSEETPNLLSAKEDTGGWMQPIIFAETFDSLSRHRSLLEDQMNKKSSGDELIAAALARVIILDERVQSLLDDIYRAEMPYATLLPCMGIWTPITKQSNLNNPIWTSTTEQSGIKCFLDKPTEKCEQLPADFLVLHLTILENLAKQDSKTEQEVLDDIRKCNGVGKDCEIVIVSGRGVPSATIHSDIGVNALNERFLPISALLEHISQPSKLALMHALWSA